MPVGKPLAINGVWAISPGMLARNNNDAAAAPAAEVYFTRTKPTAPGACLVILTSVAAELTEGNDQ